ncbi:cell proliferation protein CDC123 TDEL_0C02280 [Torulaspora delbrueckii]|uniref:Translation initiation factor eIF2 assembly protein n=1 Tax=Torulaspora delbrueckii TaxID=4950 RepID=G8ZRH5_TORDE|nr:hypothetical protein TDEL_0C02280 [Torulaspora delbrueckii]CCE91117.1 hypothetical protein TDEL_0C02280 [Torulaspora delbrueckii]
MGEKYTPLEPLLVKKEHVERCRFSNWSKLFPGQVPKSRVIKPLPREFIKYLEQDGIKLPDFDQEKSTYTSEIARNEDNEYSDWEDDDGVDDTKVVRVDPIKDFPKLHEEISLAINDLGSVAPKLNWSAPRDATWMLPNNTMKCTEINEVYLLLNASNYIMHDLQHAFEGCEDFTTDDRRPEYELVLRQWFDINPALEFRVFIRNGKVLGATQRDLNYYTFLEPLVDDFKDTIDEFVYDTFLTKFSEKSCVIDIYIPRPYNKLFLIDVNPFSRKTDALMFSWNELLTKEVNENEDYELRIVPENNVARFATKEHSENHVPKDVLEASLNPEAIKELSEKWQELLRCQELEDDSDNE